MNDVARLGIAVDSRQPKNAGKDLDRFATAAVSAEKASRSLSKASKTGATEMSAFAKSARNVNSAFGNSHAIRMVAVQLGQVTQQVASGTSAMRALSIQMPDLLLGFGTFGAVAGVVAGALGPVVTGLLATEGGARAVVNATEAMEEKLSELDSQIQFSQASFAALSAEMSGTEEQMRAITQAKRDISFRHLVNEADNLTKAFSTMYDGNAFLNRSRVEDLQLAFGFLGKETRILANNMVALKRADTLEQKIHAAERLSAHFVGLAGDVNQMTSAEFEFYSMITSVEDALSKVKRRAEDIDDPLQRQLRAAKDVIASFEQQADLARAIASFGANSVQVEALKRSAALASANAFVEQEGLTGAVAERVRETALAAHDAGVNADKAAASLRAAEAASRGLASAMAAAAGFSLSLDQNVSVLEAEIAALQNGSDVAIASQITQRRLRAEGVRDAQVAAGVDRSIADAQLAIDMSQIDRQETLLQQKKRLTDAARERGKAAKSASTSAMASLLNEISYRKKLLDLTGDQRRQYAAVHTITQRLGKDAAKYSQSQLNGLANQLLALEDQEAALQRTVHSVEGVANAWGHFVVNGFSDFKGFARSILDTFKGMLAQMIAMASKNRIMIGLGLGGVSSAPAIAGQAVGAAAGGAGSGLLGGLLGGGGAAATSGIWSGVAGVFSGGGLGSSFANLGGLLSGSVGGFGAIGAALPAIGLVAAGFSLLFGKTKELDRGIRVTVDGFDSLVESFQRTETSRLFGLMRSRRTRYSAASASLADPLMATIAQLQDSVVASAGALGFGVSAFDNFSARIRISTKGLSEDEAAAEIQKQLNKVADGMASLVLDGHEVVKVGESASDALNRLSSALVGANDVMDLLGHQLFAVGISGADAASQLADAFGGVDKLLGAGQAFFAGFYSDAEQTATNIRRLFDQFAQLDQVMPQSRAEFRALIEGIDLTTEAGRSLYAALLPLSGALDQVFPQVDAMTLAMQDQVDTLQPSIADQTSGIQAAMSSAQETARLWTRASDSARNLLADMVGGPLSTVSRTQATALSARRFAGALDLGLSGDVTAAQDATGYARSYLENALASASSSAEYARISGRVMAQLSGLADVADLTGDASADMAALYGRQIDVLTGLSDYLRTSDDNLAAFTAAVAGYQSDLAGLGGSIASIAAAAGISAQAITAAQGGADVAGQLAGLGAVQGPALNQVGAARVASSSDPATVNDQAALIRELQALRAENRQLLLAINQNQRATVKGLKVIHLDNTEAQSS